MNKLNSILLIAAFLFCSCENEEIVNADLDYKELIVVQSEIIANRYFKNVRITRTLPIGANFNINDAEIKNAITYLRINKIQIIPLHYQQEGKYEPLYDFYINEGDYVELFGEVNGINLYSKTKIPVKPQTVSTNLDRTSWFAEAVVKPAVDEVYSALWGINTGSIVFSKYFFTVSVPSSFAPGSIVKTRTPNFPQEYREFEYNGKRFIQVYAFDTAFEKYFRTRGSNQEINNPFVQGSGKTEWNVIGKNVIGLFIGSNKSELILVN